MNFGFRFIHCEHKVRPFLPTLTSLQISQEPSIFTALKKERKLTQRSKILPAVVVTFSKNLES